MGRIGIYPYSFENPLTGNTMYAVRAVKYTELSEQQVIKLAADDSSVREQDMEQAFYALAQEIENLVLNGHSVTLDGLGNFRLTAKTGLWDSKRNKWKSAGKDSMDDVSPDDIKGVYIRFRPCTELRNELNNTEFFNVTKTKLGQTISADRDLTKPNKDGNPWIKKPEAKP